MSIAGGTFRWIGSLRGWVLFGFMAAWAGGGSAQQIPPDGKQLPAVAGQSSGLQLVRKGHRLFVGIDSEPADHTITIPRCYASLVRVHFLGDTPHDELTVHPEPNSWVIRWKPEVPFRKVLVLEFDVAPLLKDEVEPIAQAGDGTITLHAFQAETSGEKLRFEPQPHKNTVGYWTVPTDSATWQLSFDRPGEFNVGILQGCGKGQGGSEATLLLKSNNGSAASLNFSTIDTGHFQNFIWRSLGTILVPEEGVYELMLKPKQIAKGALMDVRMLHLSPTR